MSKDALQILQRYKENVWKRVRSYLKRPNYPKDFSIPASYKEEDFFHWRMVEEYPKRQGKYFRPTLLLLSCEAMGGITSKALNTAAAMQISEDWLLIHDDLEDGSLERRGKPTLHRIYGEELATNAGDALHVLMWKVLSDNLKFLDPQKNKEVTDEFHQMLTRTIMGQSTEIKWAKENRLDFSNKDWFFVCDGKTSYYTVAGPLRLGAIIAGANPNQLKKITRFGKHLGRCFQLVDDILDITSDFSGLKKQTGNDVYEGKRTIILGHLLRNIKGKDKERLISILSKRGYIKTREEVGWVIAKMNKYKSLEYAKKLALKLKGQALEIFETDLDFYSKEPARSNLKTLVHFALSRQH